MPRQDPLIKSRDISVMPMSPQRRPSGTMRTATTAWKLRVRQRIVELDMSRSDLARACSVTPATILNVLGREDALSPPTTTCRIMPQIHRALGWPPPADAMPQKTVDDLHDRLTRAWPDLDATERAVIDLIVARRTKQT